MLKYDISPKAKGLIFDLDGTLANTMPYHYEAWQKAAVYFGMDMTKEFLRNLMGGSAMVIAENLIKLYGKQTEVRIQEIIQVKNQFFNNLHHLVTPIDEVFDIVKQYHGKMPMAIGTGGSVNSISLTLEHTGIGAYFDIVVSAEQVKHHKPAPDTFLLCAQRMGVEPAYCQVFEDGDPGIQASERAGMITTDVRSWFDPKW